MVDLHIAADDSDVGTFLPDTLKNVNNESRRKTSPLITTEVLKQAHSWQIDKWRVQQVAKIPLFFLGWPSILEGDWWAGLLFGTLQAFCGRPRSRATLFEGWTANIFFLDLCWFLLHAILVELQVLVNWAAHYCLSLAWLRRAVGKHSAIGAREKIFD